MGIKIHTIEVPALAPGKKLFFASDFHLSYGPDRLMKEREKKILAWLDRVELTAGGIFLLGDIFDFWFEYKHVVPKGFIRFQHRLASLVSKGIPVYFVPGNHDNWIGDYFEKELGLIVLPSFASFSVGEYKICLGHGDQVAASFAYRCVKKWVYNVRLFRWCVAQLPVDLLFRMTSALLANRRKRQVVSYQNVDNKAQVIHFCRAKIHAYQQHDYYVLGHFHAPCKAYSHTCL